MNSSGKKQNINTVVQFGKILQKFKTAIFKIVIKAGLAIGVAYILYQNVSDHSTFQTEILKLAVALFILWTIASYSKGQWEDKVVTFFVFIFMYGVYRGSYWGFENVLGMTIQNPIVAGYFTMVTVFTAILLVSRYTSLNIVKATAWAIGLGTIGLFVFTYSVWGTLKLCEYDKSAGGIHDPFYIVLPIYLSWILLIGLLFWADMSSWGQTKQTLLAVCMIIAIGLVGYSWQRCAAAEEVMKGQSEEQAEKTAIREEPSWLNNGAHIATVAAWFNVFIGHYFSSAVLAFMGYAILDQCAPRNDPRVIAVSSLLVIVLPIAYFVSKSKSTVLSR